MELNTAPTCGVCNQRLVLPCGNPNNPFLVIGEYPGVDSIRRGSAWLDKGGVLLEREFALAGFNPSIRYMTTFWLHEPDMSGAVLSVTSPCWQSMFARAVMEMKNRKYILLMGSVLSKAFLDIKDATDVSGLRVHSPYWDNECVTIGCISPNHVINGTLGEFRLALKRMKGHMK